ncbi:MAG: hypothetical protein C4291_15315 [Candidatus Dadabacteria bacterium]
MFADVDDHEGCEQQHRTGPDEADLRAECVRRPSEDRHADHRGGHGAGAEGGQLLKKGPGDRGESVEHER